MKPHFFIKLLLSVLISLFANVVNSQQQAYIMEVLTTGLGVPWGMTFLADDDLLITQREGLVSKLNVQTGEIIAITGLPAIKVGGQGGLFDIQTSPNYSDDGWLYLSYNKDIAGQGNVVLARAKLTKSIFIDWQELIITKSGTDDRAHYGGRITFDDNGHVYLSIGDRGIRSNAQNTANHAGSILRLKLDGSVPSDNPFINDDKVLDEIWSLGHRNPQGLFFNPDTKQLWSIEHGPRGGDEINLIEAGKNYGWPIISHGKEYFAPIAIGEGTEREGLEQPIKVYIPSIAPSSLIQYRGSAFMTWQGNLLSGALSLKHLNRIELDGSVTVKNEQRLLSDVNERIRNVIEDHRGWVYVSTDSGKIIRLIPR